MRDKTRRVICRIAFLTLCLLPCAVTCTLIAYRMTPFYVAAERAHWQQWLESRTGLRARIERVSRPRRGDILLERVTFVDPDTRRELARMRLLEMAQTDHGFVILVSQPEIEDGQFQRLWEVFHTRVLRAGDLPSTIRLNAAELTLHAQPQAVTFTDVRFIAEPFDAGTRAQIGFRVAGMDMVSAAQLRIIRNRENYPPVTGWQLRTGPTPLPCSLFADYCPPLERLGAACRFQGSMWAEETRRGWDGEIAGRFHDVDLEQLIEPFPHKLSGTAEVAFNLASFRGGRLFDAAGSLRAEGGVISTSLITTLADAFHLRVETSEPALKRPLREYQRLAAGFQLDAQGLQISGLCDATTTGAVLVDRTGTILADSADKRVPAVALARALSPNTSLHVPATEETDLLLRALPLPGVQPSAPLIASPPYAPLRLKE